MLHRSINTNKHINTTKYQPNSCHRIITIHNKHAKFTPTKIIQAVIQNNNIKKSNDNISYHATRIDNKSKNVHSTIQPHYTSHNDNKIVNNNKCNQSSPKKSITSSSRKYNITQQTIQIHELESHHNLMTRKIKTKNKIYQASSKISTQIKNIRIKSTAT